MARQLLKEAGVAQRDLAERMGTSQNSVSRMLGDRSAALSFKEVFAIEAACGVKPGTTFDRLGLLGDKNLLELIWEIPGADDQAKDLLVGAIVSLETGIARRAAQQ
jgi:transcriptional regulator with XRE-family HTH domain